MFLQNAYLQFAPKTTLVTSDAVHNSGNVPKMVAKLHFEFGSLVIGAREERSFVKVIREEPLNKIFYKAGLKIRKTADNIYILLRSR